MSSLAVHALPTPVFHAGDSLAEFVAGSVPKAMVRERMVLAVTSKIVSLAEGRLVDRAAISKQALVERESDHYLGEIGYGCFLTVKEGLLIPSAGIDESNAEHGGYILYPEHPQESAWRLWRALRESWQLRELGILLTDSHTSPLRRGVTGICLSHAGFRPLKNLVGSRDLFGRELKVTQMNLADGLAAAAVLLMGEAAESCPIAVLEGAPLEFCDSPAPNGLSIPLEEDLYFPLLEPLLGKPKR